LFPSSLVDQSVETDAAEPKGHNAMRNRENVIEIIADHDDGNPASGYALNQVEGSVGLAKPERRSRFIELNETVCVYRGPGDRNRLALAAR